MRGPIKSTRTFYLDDGLEFEPARDVVATWRRKDGLRPAIYSGPKPITEQVPATPDDPEEAAEAARLDAEHRRVWNRG